MTLRRQKKSLKRSKIRVAKLRAPCCSQTKTNRSTRLSTSTWLRTTKNRNCSRRAFISRISKKRLGRTESGHFCIRRCTMSSCFSRRSTRVPKKGWLASLSTTVTCREPSRCSSLARGLPPSKGSNCSRTASCPSLSSATRITCEVR